MNVFKCHGSNTYCWTVRIGGNSIENYISSTNRRWHCGWSDGHSARFYSKNFIVSLRKSIKSVPLTKSFCQERVANHGQTRVRVRFRFENDIAEWGFRVRFAAHRVRIYMINLKSRSICSRWRGLGGIIHMLTG